MAIPAGEPILKGTPGRHANTGMRSDSPTQSPRARLMSRSNGDAQFYQATHRHDGVPCMTVECKHPTYSAYLQGESGCENVLTRY